MIATYLERGLLGLLLAVLLTSYASLALPKDRFGQADFTKVGDQVNAPIQYPVTVAKQALNCEIDLAHVTGTIDSRIFGTNLEWFNEGGGLSSPHMALRKRIAQLATEQGVSVMRYPGGTLSDFYDWHDGIGPVHKRPTTKHPTDSGRSKHSFGSPEFFQFLKETNSQGLVTVNVGTGTPKLAADWVAYANQAEHSLRARDGFKSPIGIKLWEIGNEVYLPGNPGEKKITQTPEQYAQNYLDYSKAIKAVDPTVKTIAIGVASSHIGPDTPYPNWTSVLLEKAGHAIDMIAVHNSYFPMLYHERQPHVKDVYPSLMASPEAVDDSLTKLEQLIKQHQPKRDIGIAITEWGGLFSLPNVDNYWVDHVKTMGTGVYVARMLQVMMSHPSVKLANYFKLTDRSFMGWINYKGEPKVPFWVFALYANYHGDQRLQASINSPTYQTKSIGIMKSEQQVPVVTVLASKRKKNGQVYVNLVNRSLTTAYPIKLSFRNGFLKSTAMLHQVQTRELTAHNGRDIPPEWPYDKKYEPYSTAKPNSIKINTATWTPKQPLKIAPFSVMTLVFDAQ